LLSLFSWRSNGTLMSKYNIGVLYFSIGVAGFGAAIMRGEYGFTVVPLILIGAALYIMHLTSEFQS
jgi:hypothetical protein